MNILLSRWLKYSSSKSRIPLPRPVGSPSHVASSDGNEEQNNLEQEPSPASALLLTLQVLEARTIFRAYGRSFVVGVGVGVRVGVAIKTVQVVRLDRDDVVVVAQLTSFGGESEVRDGRNSDVLLRGFQCETVVPGVFGLVLQLQGQGLVVEVSQTGFGGD